ncbi:MAG: HEAT repeat domain-containing protein [Anaerolineae bacterium]|nr:HEAT repeat domain-containing protein [Anaerolineae bacterium]
MPAPNLADFQHLPYNIGHYDRMNTHMPDTLFISYKSEENPFALQLAAALKNRGVNVWIDRMDIQTGDNWVDSIGAALRNCSGMIAILTPDYFRSPVCLDELNFAYAEKRPILPLLLRNIFDERDHDIQVNIPFWLPRRQWLDFTDFLDDAAFQRQFDILLRRIQAEQQGVVGDRPSAEIQYLTSLIADLESQQGVENYIALSAQSEIVRVDPRPRKNIEPSLALLLKPPTPERDERPATKKIDNIQQAVADHPKFVLIGDPGAGKTTTLRRLALEMARARLEELTSPPGPLSNRRGGEIPIPCLVYLPRWSAEPTAADFIRRQWAATNMGGDVVRELQSGQVRLYLDGLNEMGGEGKKKAALLREWLQAANGPRYAVITCRQADYHDDLTLGDLPTVLVEPLTDEKIREFAVQYLGEEQAGSFLEKVFPQYEEYDGKFEREQKNERSLLHLARNPYLLAALTLIFENGGDLPRNTGALFHQLVIVLWERERLRQTPSWIPFEEMQAAFGNLAFSMIDEDQPIDVPLNYAEAKLRNADLLGIGRSANLITIGGSEMRYSHQSMLEYFAAAGLLKVGLATRLRKPEFGIFGRRATKWDEVVLASCGLVSEPATVVNKVVGIDPFLAAACIGSGIEITATAHENVVDRLLIAMCETASVVRAEAAKALGRIGDPAAVPYLVDARYDMEKNVRSWVGWALGQIGDPAAVPYLVDALRDIDSRVRSAAEVALGRIGTSAIPALSDALRDADSGMRSAAAIALGQIGTPAAISALVDTLHDVERNVRYMAAGALEQIGTPAIPALLDALHDADSNVRAMVAYALGNIGDPSTIPALLDALHDAGSGVRSKATRALEKISTPEALEAVRRWREEQGESDG